MSNYAGFNSVELRRPKRSHFDLSHDRRMNTIMGRLTPVVVTECMPSDTFRGSTEILLRLAPLLAPIFDRIELFVHFFFVPNRLLWAEWEKFITGGRLGVGVEPVTAPIPPRLPLGAVQSGDPAFYKQGTLADYLGVPDLFALDPNPSNWSGKYIDAMPFAAYQCIWLNYYQDRNFENSVDTLLDDNGNFRPLPSGTAPIGDYGTDLLPLRQRCYGHDYFTSALPWTQRGEQVLMPVELAGLAPIYANPPATGATSLTMSGIKQPGAVAVGLLVNVDESGDPPTNAEMWVRGQDFTGASTTINDFRSAYALQVWLERNAVGGSRYNESTYAHFGVKPQDSRLQRPEYIGGGKIPVQISEVVSTAWANDGTADVPQANMAGHGITYGNTNQFNYFCTEHGFIMGIVSIMPVTSYLQGLPRMFRRGSFLDYPWPTFAKLGEQPVYDYEIYANPAALTPDADGEYPDFGYQSRYADWKSIPSTNHGDFKDSLLFWTLTRKFDLAPTLGLGFNTVQPTVQSPDNRIFAVPVPEEGDGSSGNYWMYVHNKISVKRALPYFGTSNTLGFQ